jgi:hypothetical protein
MYDLLKLRTADGSIALPEKSARRVTRQVLSNVTFARNSNLLVTM